MSEETDREAMKKYLGQTFVAVALLLVLYGFVQLLNIVSDLTNVYISYNWWMLFQIIAAFLIIFIGVRIYLMARKTKFANLSKFWCEIRLQFLSLSLALLSVAPFVLYPMPASSSLYPPMFQPYSIHNPISFYYKIDYRWNLGSGGTILLYTAHGYHCCNFVVLVDVITVDGYGWIVVPYEIYRPKICLPAFGPAKAKIELGMIENGEYILKVVMSDTIDLFKVHKTQNKFWVEEVRVKYGMVVQKSEFEKRLDGFKITFIGFPEIDNETKEFIRVSINEIGGKIVETKSYFEGLSVEWFFYYEGALSHLRGIIRKIVEKHPEYMIGIYSNTGWYALTWVPDSYKP